MRIPFYCIVVGIGRSAPLKMFYYHAKVESDLGIRSQAQLWSKHTQSI